MPRGVHVCFGYVPDMTPLTPKPATDPECEAHEPEPSGYVEWFEWAAQMARTHVQRRCKGCGLYCVWVPKTPKGL